MSSFQCEKCGAVCTDSPKGYTTGCEHYPASAMGKRLSDDPGIAEMKRMEYLMSKAPCLARLKELADWSEGKD